MHAFTHIIAKWNSGHWAAWFKDSAHIQSKGDDAIDAIYKLMAIHCLTDLATVQVVSVDDGSAAGRMELRASDIDRSQYPVDFSSN